jgi:hypothetical protein
MPGPRTAGQGPTALGATLREEIGNGVQSLLAVSHAVNRAIAPGVTLSPMTISPPAPQPPRPPTLGQAARDPDRTPDLLSTATAAASTTEESVLVPVWVSIGERGVHSESVKKMNGSLYLRSSYLCVRA